MDKINCYYVQNSNVPENKDVYLILEENLTNELNDCLYNYLEETSETKNHLIDVNSISFRSNNTINTIQVIGPYKKK